MNNIVWHDCKTDPPVVNGEYLLWYKEHNTNYWCKSYYGIDYWYSEDCVPFNNPNWGFTNSIPYKWAEVDLSEVE